jgi:hypothetical protein
MTITALYKPFGSGFRLYVQCAGMESPANLHLVKGDMRALDAGFCIEGEERASRLADELQLMLDGTVRRKEKKRLTGRERALIAVQKKMARAMSG